jgi:hypothetical protein
MRIRIQESQINADPCESGSRKLVDIVSIRWRRYRLQNGHHSHNYKGTGHDINDNDDLYVESSGCVPAAATGSTRRPLTEFEGFFGTPTFYLSLTFLKQFAEGFPLTCPKERIVEKCAHRLDLTTFLA